MSEFVTNGDDMKVKVYFNDLNFVWRYNESNPSLSTLQQFASQRFNLNMNEVSLQYNDEEDCRTGIQEDEDLNDAFVCAQHEKRKILKIYLIPNDMNTNNVSQQKTPLSIDPKLFTDQHQDENKTTPANADQNGYKEEKNDMISLVSPKLYGITEDNLESITKEELKELDAEHIHIDVISEKEDEINNIFNKWMTIFEMQIKHNVSFDHTIFTEMIIGYDSNPLIAIKLKYDNYKTSLDKKDYCAILKSFIGWLLTLKCEYLRCNGKSKLNCFCDIHKFQLFSYYFIIGLMKCKLNNDTSKLDILGNITNTVSFIANHLCSILSEDFQNNKYFGMFKKYIIKWLQHELYNFQCSECGYINKTIMINRVYEYSITLNYCRFCNALQESRVQQNPNQIKFDMDIAIQQKPNQQYNNYDGIDNDGYIYDINDKAKQYPIYYIGPAIRYTVINPKYASFAQEILLNDMYSFTKQEWEELLMDGQKFHKEYLKLNELQSTETNINYGIETYEQIGINHLLAVQLFCYNTEYAKEFNKSYWYHKSNLNVISNNFYWMGRYLYEIVQFFGTNIDEIEKPLYVGISKLMIFDSFAPIINHTITASTDMNICKSYIEENEGIILELSPKYYNRDIDNSKLVSLNKLYKKDGNQDDEQMEEQDDEWLFVGKTALQINIIDNADSNEFGLALMYLEKIFNQSIFDIQSYNAKGIYTKNIVNKALKLINIRTVDGARNKSEFPSYIIALFDHWCEHKEFLNFETFLLEKDKMDPNLQYFLFDADNQKIKIGNLKSKLFPNISSFYDIDGTLKFIDDDIKSSEQSKKTQQQEVFRSLYNSQQIDIPYHVTDALEKLGFDFGQIFQSEEKSDNDTKQQIIESKNDIDSHTKINDPKLQFIERYKHLFDKFATVLLKRDKATSHELKTIAISEGIFDKQMSDDLANHLFTKILEDRERMKYWKCRHCSYVNQKIMIGGMYRLYHQNSRCGLCGDYRYLKLLASEKNDELKEDESSAVIVTKQKKIYKLPQCIKDEWEKINHDAQCLLLSFENISNKQLIHALQNYLFDRINDEKKKQLLMHHKENIIEYFDQNKIDGYKFVSMTRKDFMNHIKKHCNDARLSAALTKLYNEIKQCNYDEIVDLPDTALDEDIKEVVTYDEEKYKQSLNLCSAMKRLHIILQYFEELTVKLPETKNRYPHSMKQFLKSLPDYGVVRLLNDTQHIVRHQSQSLCKGNIDCVCLKRASRDRNTKQCRLPSEKQLFFNTDNPNEFIYISMLDEAHVLLKHSKQEMDTQIAIKKLTKDVNVVDQPVFNTGVYINYAELKPLYPNLKDEVTRNKTYSITEEQFEEELEDVKLFMKTDNIANKWKASKTDDKYGIKLDQTIQIQNILCIKLYCNHTTLCRMFRMSYYQKERYNDPNDTIIKRHCNNYYWFGRFLTNAIEFYGTSPSPKKKFYHGLSGKFRFNQFSAIFETPTSTTWSVRSAAQFMKDGVGIVLELSSKYKNEISFSKYLDVAKLSNFKHEQEKLFAGMTVLAITNIYSPSDNKWDGYEQYVNAMLYFERITEQTVHQKLYYNHGIITDNIKEKWIKIQNDYLIPILVHQMSRNMPSETKKNDIPTYIRLLIEHFFDNKRVIDISCIQDEIHNMIPSLKSILFEEKESNDTEKKIEYEINNINIKRIFPNLKQYKHYSGHWINLEAVSAFDIEINRNAIHNNNIEYIVDLSSRLRGRVINGRNCQSRKNAFKQLMSIIFGFENESIQTIFDKGKELKQVIDYNLPKKGTVHRKWLDIIICYVYQENEEQNKDRLSFIAPKGEDIWFVNEYDENSDGENDDNDEKDKNAMEAEKKQSVTDEWEELMNGEYGIQFRENINKTLSKMILDYDGDNNLSYNPDRPDAPYLKPENQQTSKNEAHDNQQIGINVATILYNATSKRFMENLLEHEAVRVLNKAIYQQLIDKEVDETDSNLLTLSKSNDQNTNQKQTTLRKSLATYQKFKEHLTSKGWISGWPDTIILDIGSSYCKIGFLGYPQSMRICRTLLHYNIDRSNPLLFMNSNSSRILKGKMLYDATDNKILNNEWRDIAIMLLNDVFEQLKIKFHDNVEYHIILPLNPNINKIFKERIISTLLNRYSFKIVRIVDPFQCSLLTTDAMIGIVIDIGSYTTKLKVIHPSMDINNCDPDDYIFGFESIIQEFKRLMKERARLDFDRFNVDRSQIENCITRTCFVEPKEGLDDDLAPNAVSYEFNVKKQSAFCKITPTVRRSIYNVLFTEINIAKITLDKILESPQEIHQDLANNILLTGGVIQIPGFMQRFREEIQYNLLNDEKYEKLRDLEFNTLICPFQGNIRTFMGATIYASLLNEKAADILSMKQTVFGLESALLP